MGILIEPNPGTVGVIADTHLPAVHPRYLEFIIDTFAYSGVDTVVHIGDWFDWHAMSFHEADPDGDSPGDELAYSKELAQRWYKEFPNVYWCLGNHDNLPARRVRAAGLTKEILRRNLTGAPKGWIAGEAFILGGVRYSHGIGSAGIMGHVNLCKAKGMSVVMGHCHSFGAVNYIANEFDLRFGMNVGCGVDIDHYAMLYGRDFVNRPTLGCGIVYHKSHAEFIPMDMTRYSRDRS